MVIAVFLAVIYNKVDEIDSIMFNLISNPIQKVIKINVDVYLL